MRYGLKFADGDPFPRDGKTTVRLTDEGVEVVPEADCPECPDGTGGTVCSLTAYDTAFDFLAAITGTPATDTYDDLPLSVGPAAYIRTAGDYTYIASAFAGSSPHTFFPAGTSGDVWLGPTSATDQIELTNFTSGVRAVGGFFFATDVNGLFLANQSITIIVTLEDDTAQSFTLTNTTTSTFRGFITTCSFKKILVKSAGPQEAPNTHWPTINDLRIH